MRPGATDLVRFLAEPQLRLEACHALIGLGSDALPALRSGLRKLPLRGAAGLRRLAEAGLVTGSDHAGGTA